jgi:fructosamine-3-kinase
MQMENQLMQIQADKAARLAIPTVVPATPAAVDSASGGEVADGSGIAEGGSSFFQAMMDMQSTALAAAEADREQLQAAKAQDRVDKQLAAYKSRSKVAGDAPDADELMANVQSQFD